MKIKLTLTLIALGLIVFVFFFNFKTDYHGQGQENGMAPLEFNALSPSGLRSFDTLSLPTGGHLLVFSQLYNTLFDIDGSTLRVVPKLVSKYTFNENLTKYYFTLKSNKKFHDGSTLRSQDVAYTLERVLKDRFGSRNELVNIVGAEDFYKGRELSIKGIKIIDDLNFEIHLENPSIMFLKALTFKECSILPEKYKNEIATGSFFEKPIGSGEFAFRSFDPNTFTLNLERFDKKPRGIDLLNLYVMPETTAKKAFLAGELDQLFPYHLSEEEKKNTDIAVFKPYRIYYSLYMFFNFGKENNPLIDEENRKKLEKICDLRGLYSNGKIGPVITPGVGYIPHGMPGSLVYDEEMIPEPEQGIKGFDQKILIGISERSDNAKEIVSHLREAFSGLNVEIISEDINDVMDKVKNRTYHAAIVQNIFQYPDPYSILKRFKSDNLYNYGHYNFPEFDSLLKDAFTTADKTSRAIIYKKINDLMVEKVMTINIAHGGFQRATFNRKWDVPSMNFTGELFIDYSKFYLKN